MRFFMRCWRNCRILPLMWGSPSDCLNSSLISCSDIFCRSNHCRYWKKKSAIATAASIATTAPINCSVRVVVTPRIADGSKARNDSSRCHSGHSTAIMTAPSATSLKMPLRKFAIACLPKTRLKPAPGETLLNLGESDSDDHTSRCWIMLPAMAAIISISSGTPIAARMAMPSVLPSCSSAAPSVRSMPALATRLRSGIRMPPPIDPEKVDNTSVAPAITNQVLTSWLLATSPRPCASSRRFCVGSSVLSPLSSAIAAPYLKGVSWCMTSVK